MHAVIRSYSGPGAKELIDAVVNSKAEVERLLRAVDGFMSYAVVRTTDGGFTISIYQDKAGTDESSRVARDWVAQHLGSAAVPAPTISEGAVILHLK
jgi:hypothetical protein